MTKGLKRCPFCNQDAAVLTETEDYRVVCGNCAASTGCFETAKEAVNAWNDRPLEKVLTSQIHFLDGEIERLRSLYISKDKDLLVKFERNQTNARNALTFGFAYDFDNIRALNEQEKKELSKMIANASKFVESEK